MAAKADDKSSTVSLPPGLHVVAKVVAAEGPDTIRDQLARGKRNAFLQDPTTGVVLFAFPEPPGFWRTPPADEVLATGTLTRLRPRGGTLHHPIWPIPNFETVTVIVSDLVDQPPLLAGGRDAAVPSRKPAELDAKPSPQSGPPTELDAKGWVVAEAQRMQAAGKIPSDIRITAFAKELARRMEEEAGKKERSLHPVKHPVKWTYIKNNLRDWGLWPVSRIRIL